MTHGTSRTPVKTGGCQCGALRYALYAQPAALNLCHCRMCQKAVGGPFAAFVPNQAADFAWTQGTPGTFASSNIAKRDYCRDCGTPLTYRGPSGRVNVTYGSLDDPGDLAPGLQLGVEAKRAWVDRLASVRAIRTDEDLTPAQLAAIVKHQHPDGETGT